ncbi:carbohydrate binding-domain-containing protein [Mycena amicta]|nr:carbohydrate binding-domain-containing protein [Mycena amicta]
MPCSRSRLTCLVLAAVLAATVSAQTLLDCGESRYFPSQYTCFDGDFLCPITDDVDFLRCGLACYNTQDYACSNSTLEQNTHDPNQLLACGEAFFSPLKYDCFDGTFLCPKYEGEASLRCGDACYFTEQYTCNADDALEPKAAAPDCVPNFGASQVCNDAGCFPKACCPGLISIGDKCRDPCDLNPQKCWTGN